MPAADLSLLIDAALAAARIALGFTAAETRRWDKPDGAGPVTEADLAVNRMLEDTLRAARPDYGWLSEETEDDPARLDSECVFIIDPIDGTRSFANGSDTWAHSLAIAHQGTVVAGVVFLPARNMLYTAAAGQGAFLNEAGIRSSKRSRLSGAEILAARSNLDPSHWPQGVPEFKRAHRPSLAYRMALVAQGRYDAMFTFRPSWEWDIAAGDLILREAGAICTDKIGECLRFNNPHPTVNGVVAAGESLHAQVLDALIPDRRLDA